MKYPAKKCIITVSDLEDSAEAREIQARLKADIENDVDQVADRRPFVAIVQDPDGVFHGGIRGFSHWNWLYISQLWVEPDYRHGGLGAQLLMHAEHEAQSRKLTGVYVDTFSPKAREFYLKQGYAEFGKISDFPPGQTRSFFTKRL